MSADKKSFERKHTTGFVVIQAEEESAPRDGRCCDPALLVVYSPFAWN